MTDAPSRPPLLASSDLAADFVLDVLQTASDRPDGSLAWPEINRLAARWLRLDAEAGVVNTSQLGHALVLEMADHGLLEAETTTTRDGTLMVERVLHPLIFGLDFGRSLAA